MGTIEKVEELLQKSGISKRAMAKRIGVPASTFAHLFAKPHREHLPYRYGIKIADALGIDPNELYNNIPNIVIARSDERPVLLSASDKQDPEKLLRQICLAFDMLPYDDQFELYRIAMQRVLDISMQRGDI